MPDPRLQQRLAYTQRAERWTWRRSPPTRFLQNAARAAYMQLFTKDSRNLRAMWIDKGFLADRDGCNAWQRCETSREKASTAGSSVYPGFTYLGEEDGKKGSTRGRDRCKRRRVETAESKFLKDNVVRVGKLCLVRFRDRMGVSVVCILMKSRRTTKVGLVTG